MRFKEQLIAFIIIALMVILCAKAHAVESYDYTEMYETSVKLYEQCQEALSIKPEFDMATTTYKISYDRVGLYELCKTMSAYDLSLVGEVAQMSIKNLEFPEPSGMRGDVKVFADELAKAVCDLEAIIILKTASLLSDQVTVTF